MDIYIYNVAALSLGWKGVDRREPPKTEPSAAAPAVEGKATLKQQAHEPGLTIQSVHMLDRSAYVFGSVENYHKQRCIIQMFHFTSEFRSRPPGLV